MKLTGKTKEDFQEWLINYFREVRPDYRFNLTDGNILVKFRIRLEAEKNALIIEFFDSVKIYISINYVDMHTDLRSEKGFQSLVSHKNLSTMFRVIKSRKEATDKAIEKANEIYNNKLA